MAKYKQGLKAKVQNALIYIQNAKSMRELIDQAVRIDNRIYQREKITKGQSKPTQKSLQ